MDDLRIALLITGVVVVAAIYVFARLSRREAAGRSDESDRVTRGSRDGAMHDSDESASLDPRSPPDGAGAEADVGRLEGIFAPRREASDAELSVDVSILAGLRATWESTMDGSLEASIDPGPSRDDGAAEPAAPADRVHSTAPADAMQSTASAGGVHSIAPADTAPPISIDMSRPLVYLTLVAKHERVSGQVVLDSLAAEGFRPGLMQLYYWRADAEPSVVFGVANMVEPGVLDPDKLPEMETPGLVTFMSVPRDTASAFKILDVMITVSRHLARRIDATLCDETRSTLTAQAANHLREKVVDILRRDRI